MLVVLLVISFLILAMPPLVHKKVVKRTTPNSHGRYECWISPDDGQVYEYYATSTEGTVSGYEGTPTRPGRLAPGGVCHFDAKKMAGNAAYFIFQAIGGGAGGSYAPHENGNAKYQGETGASYDITLTTTTSDPEASYYFSYKESLASAPDWVKDKWVPIPANTGNATLCTGAWEHTWTDEDTTATIPTIQPDGTIKYETVVIPGETHHEEGNGKCVDADLSKITIGADDYLKITTDKGTSYSKVSVGNVAPCSIERDTVTDCAAPIYSAPYPNTTPTNEAQVVINSTNVFPATVTLKRVNEFDSPTFGYAGSPGAGVSMFLPSIKEDLSFQLGAGGNAGTATSFKGEDGEDTIIAYNCETGTCVNTIKAEGGKGGTSHILDKIEFRELTNEEIKNYSTGAATINLEDTLSTQSLSSQSEFSSLGFLSSISNISNDTGELLSEILGKSGDGGYVTHHCWLQPQYFVYSADHVEIPNYPTSDYEGYTNFSEGVITGLPQCTAKPGGLENQFDEELGKPGKSGAIVIMW